MCVCVASKAFGEATSPNQETLDEFPLPCSREKPVSSTSRTLIRSLQDDCDKKTGERKKGGELKKKKMLYAVVCACAAKL